MKATRHLIALFSIFYTTTAFSQGTGCTTPFVLIPDAVCRTYTLASVNGSAIHCNTSIYTGTGYVTIFSFTTNASGDCVLINLTTSGNQPAEVTLFDKCSGGGALQNQEATSSVCFDDGTGLWAPCETVTLIGSKTYFLRIWTPGPGTITLCTKNYTPPNNTCSGATLIGSVPVTDNNACHKPGTGVTPGQLCAFSLENTAFYSYLVDVAGISVIMINNIVCDNSSVGAVAGFQIGFFTGDCNALVPISCYAGTGGSVSAPTISLPQGTRVTVAIDGMSGSNCTYNITAFNAVYLPITLKHFTAWVTPGSNQLNWATMMETGDVNFNIEKSADGLNFFTIGSVHGRNHSSTETTYGFEDRRLLPNQYYRLKITSSTGKPVYSNIAQLKRENIEPIPVIIENPVSDKLHIRLNSSQRGIMKMQIVDVTGRTMLSQNSAYTRGDNDLYMDIHRLAKGVYYLVVPTNDSQKGYSFIKQ
jgi:hypothetical protein